MTRLFKRTLTICITLLFWGCSEDSGFVAPVIHEAGSVQSVESTIRMSNEDVKFWVSSALKGMNITTDEINEIYKNFPLSDSIVSVKVRYYTTNELGTVVVASGAMLIPIRNESIPLLSIQHGIQTSKPDVPSSQIYNDSFGNKTMVPEYIAALITSSSGFATVLPDYLGLGVSDGVHPFCHKDLSATATVDLIKAARSVVSQLKATNNLKPSCTINNNLFLFGHSQGGYSTIAALDLLEKKYSTLYPVTATAASAAPYALRAMADTVLRSDPMKNNIYAPYLLHMVSSYEKSGSISEIFHSSVAQQIPTLFSGTFSVSHVATALPTSPSAMFSSSFLDGYKNNSGTAKKILDAVAKHDLLSLSFSTPIQLYCSNSDYLISPSNTVKADSAWKANGTPKDLLTVQYVTGDHSKSFIPAMINSFKWFQSKKS